jgi:gamma-glutamyl:cysteine ligase YbdK (ATP-grasp superfamily)
MDSTLVTQLGAAGLCVTLLIGAVHWLVGEFKDVRGQMQKTTSDMQARCDAERAALSAEIAKVRDAHAADQRDLLRATAAALADNAKSFGKLVEMHERRDGSGLHTTQR